MKLLSSYLVVAICYQVGYTLPNNPKNVPSAERFNFFDSELLKAIAKKNSGNLVISPVGVKLILGILLEGAHGETAEELRNILRLPQDTAQVRKEFDTWLSLIQSVNKHSFLKISNLLLVAKKYSVRRGFQKVVWKHYEGDVTPVKFHNRKETSRMINSWVANKTNHLITNLTEEHQINSDSQMILLNTLYFKGVWLNPFEREKSFSRCFYTLDGRCVKTCMLSATGHYKHGYIDQLDAHAIQLPYMGSKYFMLILLPNSKGNIFAMTRDLVHVSIKSILKQMREEEISIRIPRFEISYSEDIAESLMQLEVTEAFRRNANFSKMFQLESDAPSLSHIFHSAKITVQEGGTVAAAATGASFVPLMGGPLASFNAQHPFLFFLMDSAMNCVIFAGRFMQPDLTGNSVCSTGKRSFSQVKPKTEEILSASLKSTLKKITIDTISSKVSPIVFPKSRPNSKSRKPSTVSASTISQMKPETTKILGKAAASSTIFESSTTPVTHIPAKRKQSSHLYSSSPSPTSTKYKSTTLSNSSTTTIPTTTTTTTTRTTTTTTTPTPTTTTTPATTVVFHKSTKRPLLTTSTKTKSLITTPRTRIIHKKFFNNPFVRFPTEKPSTRKVPTTSTRKPDSSEEDVRPVLIHGEVPFLFYPFSSKLKEVYAGLESTTLRTTTHSNKIPITSSLVFREEETNKRWERLKGDLSDPSSWRHRVLYFV